MTKYTTLLCALLLLGACSSQNRSTDSGPAKDPFCRKGARLCECDGNDVCDGDLLCLKPQRICIKNLKDLPDETSDGGELLGAAGGSAEVDASFDDTDAAVTDAGVLEVSDGAVLENDAQVAPSHEAFVGNWSCPYETTTDQTGKLLSPSKTGTRTVNIEEGTYAVQDFFGWTYDTHFESVSGNVADETLIVLNADAQSAYRLTLDANGALQGSWTNLHYPKALTTMHGCTKP